MNEKKIIGIVLGVIGFFVFCGIALVLFITVYIVNSSLMKPTGQTIKSEDQITEEKINKILKDNFFIDDVDIIYYFQNGHFVSLGKDERCLRAFDDFLESFGTYEVKKDKLILTTQYHARAIDGEFDSESCRRNYNRKLYRETTVFEYKFNYNEEDDLYFDKMTLLKTEENEKATTLMKYYIDNVESTATVNAADPNNIYTKIQNKYLSTSQGIGSQNPEVYYFDENGYFVYYKGGYCVKENNQVIYYLGKYRVDQNVLILEDLESLVAYNGTIEDDVIEGKCLKDYEELGISGYKYGKNLTYIEVKDNEYKFDNLTLYEIGGELDEPKKILDDYLKKIK